MTQETASHTSADGHARMVDVGDNKRARHWRKRALDAGRDVAGVVLSGDAKKGVTRAAAEIAGVMAGKRTSDLIPLCHPIPLSSPVVEVAQDEGLLWFVIRARARTTGQTGVEMEALTAASVAALTIYDMLKARDRGMRIESVRLLEKSGGASGDYRAEP
ncbi:MAG: cyclic pyranopterin monophosphate synthase MoaC [Hyphomonadaceae bacterium]